MLYILIIALILIAGLKATDNSNEMKWAKRALRESNDEAEKAELRAYIAEIGRY